MNNNIEICYYVPYYNRIYCVVEIQSDGFATYTDNKVYPVFWWTWEEYDNEWAGNECLGPL